MLRLSVRLLCLVLALCGLVVANDLSLPSVSGTQEVIGHPSLTLVDSRTLTSPRTGDPLYLVVYDIYGSAKKSCDVSTGYTLQLINGSTYATATVGDKLITITAVVDTTFSAVQNGTSSSQAGVVAGFKFKVLDGGSQPACSGLGTSLDPSGEYLKFVDVKPVLSTSGSGEGDPPIPIFAGSFRIPAPGTTSFTCSGKKAELKGVSSLLSLLMGDADRISPPVKFLSLAGVKAWRIVVYPQQIEITPGIRKLNFSLVNTDQEFSCTAKELTLKNPDVLKPQQFVVDFWPAPKLPRSVPIPCGGSNSGCWLLMKYSAQ